MVCTASLLHHAAGCPGVASSLEQTMSLEKRTHRARASVFSRECEAHENVRPQPRGAERRQDDPQIRCVGASMRSIDPKLLFFCAFRGQLLATDAQHWIDRKLQKQQYGKQFVGAAMSADHWTPPHPWTAPASCPFCRARTITASEGSSQASRKAKKGQRCKRLPPKYTSLRPSHASKVKKNEHQH